MLLSPFVPPYPFLGFPGGSAGKESTCNVGDAGSIPGLGRSPGEGKGYPLQYSGLENSMDCVVHGVAKSQTRLSDFHFFLPKHPPYPAISLSLFSMSASPLLLFLTFHFILGYSQLKM